MVENPLQGLVWKLLLVNTLSCGLEVCIAAGTVYVPPLLLQAGMEERYMTMVLAVGPVLGLIFIPIIGSASDSHQGRFGRRRPFIWMLSLGVLLGLQILPQAWRLAVLMSPQHPYWLQAALQSVAVCLTDFCGQACFTLLLALLSDLFPREEENRRAFSVNSLMTSLGGCLGFLLPAVDWRQVPIATYLGGQEAFIYALLTLLFLSCLLTTAFIPEETVARKGGRKSVVPRSLRSWSSRYCPHLFLPQRQCLHVALGQCASACMSLLPRMYAVCVHVPAVIWRLFVAKMCTWMALMSVMLFFTDFMGEGLYQGVPSADPESQKRKHYDEGRVYASLVPPFVLCRCCPRWCTSAVVSDSVMIVIFMVAVTGYTLCVLQVVPYTLMCLYHSNKQVSKLVFKPHTYDSDDPTLTKPILPCDLASPYVNGHTGGVTLSEELPNISQFAGGDEASCTPVSQRGLCFDIAILDSAYMLSQVLPAICLGSVVQLVNSVRAYMASACCFSLLAFLCSTRVIYISLRGYSIP
uniref:Solute carrier family 45 member 3 n=1 Tax=Lates calcarifer TaxID=8187 RepID=A0A4W6FJ97_LATCA